MMAEEKRRKYGPSTVAKLRVARLGDFGAFLDAETGSTSDDILLHKTQQTRELSVGEEVEVFLYLDPKHRLTASMRMKGSQRMERVVSSEPSIAIEGE